ncbi:OsmC family protein [Rhodococcus sp. IEGM 1401]|uniref:OsmC family protein n=1 Tax=unclassified Rhodococcus (in: high G+C Gram-positive bacteria) TaxID=192944 RepID=UPI0022B38803|nr:MULTISPECIES: OsmC family protein [unclassified Rhodococcus (in: high G+C Gram-positive bacteria)]MCZ4560538.1 OsmC family protein [Rhodococcus sp. IEGM 1401]MDI9920666.1 OsmC family protein [Rhodococcus sp. IEGM 1372]MDV8033298.1 OsmC family protein [Rhodococcus sp. IEGM 1414]
MNTELYTATVSASATGVTSDDGVLSLGVREPKQLGGPGEHTNPEQLMAAALSSCLVESLRIALGTVGGSVDELAVKGTVVLTDSDASGYDATFALAVSLPGTDNAEAVLAQATSICPFLKVIDGVEVTLE